MLVNFHGVELEVPDDTKYVCMDGRDNINNLNYNVYASTELPSWESKDKIWITSINEFMVNSINEFMGMTLIEVNANLKAKIRDKVKPKNSLIKVRKK